MSIKARFVVAFYDSDRRELIVDGIESENNALAILDSFASNFDPNDYENGLEDFQKLKNKAESGELELEEITEYLSELDIDFEIRFAEDCGI